MSDYPKPIPPPEFVQRLVNELGGSIEECAALPDGSGFAVASLPLPKDHWLYRDSESGDQPPMPMRRGTEDPERKVLWDQMIAAARYAIRVSTDNGKIIDFDPDALAENFVIGMLGYWTPSGLSEVE